MNNQLKYRTLDEAGLVLAPIRALYKGHFPLVLFTLLLGSLGVLSVSFGFSSLAAIPSDLSLAKLISIKILSILVILIGMAPISVAIALPIRSLWFEGKINIKNLISDMLPANRRSAGAFVIAGIFAGSIILGIQGLEFGLRLISENIKNESYLIGIQITSYGIGIVAAILLTNIAIKLITLPIVTINARLPLVKAWMTLPSILRNRFLPIICIVVLWYLSAEFVTHLFSVDSSYKNLSLTGYFLFCLTAWYFLCCLNVLILDTLEQLNVDQMRILRNSASPVITAKHDRISIDGELPLAAISHRTQKATSQFSPKDIELLLR